MILKQYEVSKINIKLHPVILFYGQNNGAKEEEILNLIKTQNIKPNVYEEKQILENYEFFYNEVVSDSLFDDKKIFIVKRATDKLVKIVEDIINKNLSNFLLILNSDNLEKK